LKRLDRFENSRFVGYRKNMKVYDCDNEEQFSKLTAIMENLDYIKLNLIQSFSPDNIDEAKNRGFKSA
tara:strand:+ start:4566 stop:4769 length:204 start_codon:yes stop_codon:yes gene_type:complete